MTVTAVLEDDHRMIDDLFAQFAAALHDGRIEAAPFREGAAALRHHIWVEEEFHFPPLRAAGALGPILVMLKEHGHIWDLLEDIEAELAEGAGAEQLLATYDVLFEALEAHNLKEERILYPAGDETLDETAARIVLDAFHGGTRPPDWRPQMASFDPASASTR